MHNLQEVLQEDCSGENVSETPPLEAKKRRSMRRAINDYCKDCTYDPEFKGGGTWRQQTEACVIKHCHLYEFRPISKPRKVGELPDEELDTEDDE